MGTTTLPLLASFNSGKIGELFDAGFMVLGAPLGKDYVTMRAASTTAARRSFDEDNLTQKAASLREFDSQLFISRIVHFLLRETAALGSDTSAADARDILKIKLQSFIGVVSHPDADLYVIVDQVQDNGNILDISVEAPPELVATAVSFRARIPI